MHIKLSNACRLAFLALALTAAFTQRLQLSSLSVGVGWEDLVEGYSGISVPELETPSHLRLIRGTGSEDPGKMKQKANRIEKGSW